MDYQVGDNVKIKPEAMIKEQGNYDGDVRPLCDLLQGTDRVVTIKKLLPQDYVVERFCQEFSIPESIILGHAFEYGDKVEFSDDGKSWVKAKFYNYRIGYTYRYETDEKWCYKFARPIRKPKLEAVPENIRFEVGPAKRLELQIDDNRNLILCAEIEDWLVIRKSFSKPVDTFLQPCQASELKVGDWFVTNPEYKVNLNRYKLVTAINDRNISVCYTVNGGISLAGYSPAETYYKVVRGEE